jgi:MFS family permease
MVKGPYSALISDLIPVEKQGIANGVQSLGFALGTLTGTLIPALILQWVPGNAKYYISYGFACLTFILFSCYTIFGVKENQVSLEEEDLPPHDANWKYWFHQHVLKLFCFPIETYGKFYLVVISSFLMYVGFYLIGPFFQYFLNDILEYRMPVLSSAIGMTIFIISSAFGSTVGGYFSDKIGPKIIIFFGLSLLISGFGGYLIVILFAYKWDYSGLILSASFIFIGFGFGNALAALNVIGHHCVPKDLMARDIAIIHQCMGIGQVFGTFIGGQILAWIKLFSIHGAYIVLILSTCFCFVMVSVLIFFVKIDFKGEWRTKNDSYQRQIDSNDQMFEQDVEDI